MISVISYRRTSISSWTGAAVNWDLQLLSDVSSSAQLTWRNSYRLWMYQALLSNP